MSIIAMRPIWHIVLISFREESKESTDAVREEVFNRLQKLAEDCGGNKEGILYWQVGKNMDLRKGVHLVEIAVFNNNEALQNFRNHPKHKELTAILCKVADWQVGDIERWGQNQEPYVMPCREI